jgi:hypothetical protein
MAQIEPYDQDKCSIAVTPALEAPFGWRLPAEPATDPAVACSQRNSHIRYLLLTSITVCTGCALQACNSQVPFPLPLPPPDAAVAGAAVGTRLLAAPAV